MPPKSKPAGRGKKKGKDLASLAEAKAALEKAADKAAEKKAASQAKKQKKEKPVKQIRLSSTREERELAASIASIVRQSSDSEDDPETASPPSKKAKPPTKAAHSPRGPTPPSDAGPEETPPSSSHGSGRDVSPANSERSLPDIKAAKKNKKKKKEKGDGSQKPKRAAKVRDTLHLTDDQENHIIEWVKNHPVLYNRVAKGHECQRNNEHLWVKLAEEMAIADFEQLKTWWETLRNRYARLHRLHTASGSGAIEERKKTPRDQFAWDHCNFLHGHVRHQYNPKPTKSALQPEPQPPAAPDAGPDAAPDVLEDADLAQVVVPAAGGPLDEGK